MRACGIPMKSQIMKSQIPAWLLAAPHRARVGSLLPTWACEMLNCSSHTLLQMGHTCGPTGAVGFCLARLVCWFCCCWGGFFLLFVLGFLGFFCLLFLLWHAREIYRNNIKRPESGGDGCAELTTGPRICQAGIYYSRGGDSYVKIKLKCQQ